jgi:hypothetical protein
VPPLQFPELPQFNPGGIGGLPGGIDIESFNKAMELRRKALELRIDGQRDPEKIKEAQKLDAEAAELMKKVAGGLGGGLGGFGNPGMPAFPDFGRINDRARLGIRMERVPALAADQLGLAPNTGIAVSMVMPNSAAEKAGLKVHDIVLEFAGKPVSDNTEDFIRRVNEVKAGEKVNMVVMRKGKKVDVKGVELPEAARRPALPRQPFELPGLLPNQPNRLPVRPLVPANRVGLPEGFNNVSYTTANDSFTLKAAKGETRYVITGSFDDAGRPAPGSVTVESDGRTHKAPSADKLPAEFQADVERLLKTVEPRK